MGQNAPCAMLRPNALGVGDLSVPPPAFCTEDHTEESFTSDESRLLTSFVVFCSSQVEDAVACAP